METSCDAWPESAVAYEIGCGIWAGRVRDFTCAIRAASERQAPVAARCEQSRAESRASQRRALSQMPMLHPVKLLCAHRSCTVHEVLHVRDIVSRSLSHWPRRDQPTHRESRSILRPCCFSQASHWVRHDESMKAGLREHSPCRAYPSHSRSICESCFALLVSAPAHEAAQCLSM